MSNKKDKQLGIKGATKVESDGTLIADSELPLVTISSPKVKPVLKQFSYIPHLEETPKASPQIQLSYRDLIEELKEADRPFQKYLSTYKPINPLMGSKLYNLLMDYLKKGGTIHIKKKNEGKFTKSALEAGESVLEHAHKVVNDPNATKLLKKRALFAINATKWNH